MPELRELSYREITRRLRKLGFRFYRQGKGSHELWVRDADGRVVPVPRRHGKNIRIGNSTGHHSRSQRQRCRVQGYTGKPLPGRFTFISAIRLKSLLSQRMNLIQPNGKRIIKHESESL